MQPRPPLAALPLLLALACTGGISDSGSNTDSGSTDSGSTDGGSSADPLVVVTFNTGTTEGISGDEPTVDGYGPQQAAWSDQYYGDGLAWLPAVEAATSFFAALQPDVVVFQEIFWTGDCATIPEEAHQGFVCQDWQDGDPTVAQRILGDGWQVACHPGKPDKCAAVHQRVGRFAGCDDDFCLEGLAGSTVEGCGSGARVGRGPVLAVDGDDFTVVNVHGSSGLTQDDQACRVQQVEQVFIDLGDGQPGANGLRNLVMGDLNTDPGRFAGFDDSADRWNDFVGEGLPFSWVTEVGEDAPGSYGGIADIDHVASDSWTGSCWHAGLDGQQAVYGPPYFDHLPVVCTLDR